MQVEQVLMLVSDLRFKKPMKKLNNVVLSFGIICFSMAIGYGQNITGKWKTVDDDTGETKSIVELYTKDGAIYGKVVELLLPEDQGKPCIKCTGENYNQPI